MILDLLIFTLGLLVAGLLALAALPAVWNRALRLSEERLARLVPLSPGEIAADRDHLRAAHAVELRRTEQRSERAEAAVAALRIEAARRESRILALDAEAARAQVAVAALEAERDGLRRDVAGLWAESGAEAVVLQGLGALAERRLEALATLGAERDGLRHDLDRARGSLAALDTRRVGLETRNEDLDRALAAARRETEAARDEAETARRDAETARREAEATRREAGAERDAAAARERTVAMPGADHAHEVEALKAELAFMSEQARSAERRAADAARAHAALAAGQDGGSPAPDKRDPAQLRAAIAALAEDVLRATG